MKLRYTPRAKLDLAEIHDYIELHEMCNHFDFLEAARRQASKKNCAIY